MQRAEQRLNELFFVYGVGGDDKVKGGSKVVCCFCFCLCLCFCFCFCFCFFASACEFPLRRKLGPVKDRSPDRARIGWEGVLVECNVRLEEMG